jgi:hypothetical protein
LLFFFFVRATNEEEEARDWARTEVRLSRKGTKDSLWWGSSSGGGER